MPTTNAYGFVTPTIDDAVDVPGDLRRLADSIGPYTIQAYVNAADRDTQISAPTEGRMAWLNDQNIMTIYNGVGWYIDSYGYDLAAEQINFYNGNGNSVTNVNTWASMSNAPNITMTNPHPTRAMEVDCNYCAWLACTGGIGVRAQVALTGGVNVTQQNWGNVLYLGSIGTTAQCSADFTAVLPAGTTTTFFWQAYRDAAAGVNEVNYPVLRVTPLRYV